MPSVTHHAPGTFCWPELATTDVRAALAFYTPLFGWTVRESPTAIGIYFVMHAGERAAAAMFELPVRARESGEVPHWGPYIGVENADEVARRAQDAGGAVRMGPFDVMDLGRMAMLRDPEGATFSIWQPISRIGVRVLNEHGALGWSQLNTRDPESARRFYPAVFGWTAHDDVTARGQSFTTWQRADGAVGGMLELPEAARAGERAQWLSFFVADDVAAAHATALARGARAVMGPREDADGGVLAVLDDPQGARFGITSVR